MKSRTSLLAMLLIALALGFCNLVAADDPIKPKETIKLFNGKDFTGLYTFLKKTGKEDPNKVFTVADGMIHVSGADNGYIATKNEYADYHLSVEFKWGKEVFGSKYVRNSGVLLHMTGEDKVWPASFECQLAQGCVGDIILIGGTKDRTMTAEIEVGPDKRPRWKEGGESKTWPPMKGQLWWNKHEPFFKELIDTRGKDDVESKLGDWTKVECLCVGDTITLKINGHTVNQITKVKPAAGKILLQSEGFEMWFRNWELKPVKQ
ncbi:MAG: DUF1080 domain-containing protein [Gemmataceae bacterium]